VAFQSANTEWYANADEIADFLAQANPRYWPQATMRAAMKAHLDQTLAEASHELTGNYAASVADYDEIHHHILDMADVLSNGILRTFPNHFH
jgi:prophage DNA circulation protein